MHAARAAVVAAALALPVAALAETSAATGAAGLSASASVNFKIVIPEVLALSVGADAVGPNTPARHASLNTSTILRGSRSAIALPQQPDITLRSNMRQVTVIQDLRGRPVYTVVAP